MSYSSEVLTDSPLTYLKLDEASGTVAADATGQGRPGAHNTGVAVGQPSLLADGSGLAAKYVATVTSTTSITYGSWMNSAGLTVECRIKPDATALTATSVIGGRWNIAPQRMWQFTLVSGKLRAIVRNSSGVEVAANGTTSLVANTTYTVAVTYDGSTIRLYLNGVLDGSSALAGPANSFAAVDTTVGILTNLIDTAAYHFPGIIDEFAIFGTALSATRLSAHHSAAITGGSGSVTGTITAPIPGPVPSVNVTVTAPTATATANLPIPGPNTSIAATVDTPAGEDSTIDLPIPGPSLGVAVVITAPDGLINLPIPGPSVEVVTQNEWADTDTTNLGNGRSRIGSGEDHTLYPVKPLPAHLTVTKHRIMAQQMPAPVLVDGKPT